MRSDPKHGMAFAALLALAVVGISAAALMAPVSADPGDYDQDMGSFHSMSCRFIYTGEGADTVTWDFGDGSEPVVGMNVDHTFPAPGVYVVTQTATNVIGSSVEKYRVEILGYPAVTYDLGYDGLTVVAVQDAYNVPAKTIVDPVRTGYEFKGWYADAELTAAFDMSAGIKEPVTVYAGWTALMYPVTVVLDGGTLPSVPEGWVLSGSDYVKEFPFGTAYAGAIADIGTPSRDGYAFGGWDPSSGILGVDGAVLTVQWTEDVLVPGPLWDDMTSIIMISSAALIIAAFASGLWIRNPYVLIISIFAAIAHMMYYGVIAWPL